MVYVCIITINYLKSRRRKKANQIFLSLIHSMSLSISLSVWKLLLNFEVRFASRPCRYGQFCLFAFVCETSKLCTIHTPPHTPHPPSPPPTPHPPPLTPPVYICLQEYAEFLKLRKKKVEKKKSAWALWVIVSLKQTFMDVRFILSLRWV